MSNNKVIFQNQRQNIDIYYKESTPPKKYFLCAPDQSQTEYKAERP